MKKSITLMLLFLSILPLSACGLVKQVGKEANPPKNMSSEEKQTVDKNSQHWNDKIENAKIETSSYDGQDDYDLIPTSMKELKQYNDVLIKGTVYNLQEMKGVDNDAYTKVSVFVNKVISGNKNLQGKIINFSLNSGFIYKPDQKKYNYDKRIETPMPPIGSQIITGLTPRKIYPKSTDSVDKFFIENDAAGKYAFNLNNPVNNLWIKKDGQKQFHLNNPNLNAEQKDDWYSTKLLELTKKINQYEN